MLWNTPRVTLEKTKNIPIQSKKRLKNQFYHYVFKSYFVYEILQIWKKYGFFGHSDAEGIFQKLVKTKNVSHWLLNIDLLHHLVLRRDRVTENTFGLGGNDDTYADGFYDPQWSAFDNLNILGSQSGGPGAIGPNEMLNSYSKYVSGTF